VLFIDLVGFTSLSERRDAEDTRELLSRYFALSRAVVGRHGGVVEKFIGDAVMAVWGAPVAREDDAARAVRAALEVVESVGEFGRELDAPELRARGGVATGRAASWASSEEGLVVGDLVNTASRVQSAATPGTVFVGALTREATHGLVEYQDAGLHALKGKADQLHLWQAIRPLARDFGKAQVRLAETGLVGRERELKVLESSFHSVAERSRAALLTVSGPAGVGKSRLLGELERHVQAGPPVVWHQTEYSSYGGGVAYAALASLVRERLGIGADDEPLPMADKLEQGMSEYLPNPHDRAFATPKLAALMGIPVDTEPPSREEFFAGWRMFLEAVARTSPLVLAIDNLQWADAGMLDFTDQLLDWSTDLPILVVALTRPGFLQRRPAWATRRNGTLLHLERLSDAEVEALLVDLVPVAPPAARRQIVDRAEGIPLYAVETVNMLAGRGVIVERDGHRELAEELTDLDTPVTLEGLIAARLDELESAESQLVKDLAVLGASFSTSAAAAVSGLDPGVVGQLLNALAEKDVLVTPRERRAKDVGEYAFSQTLLRSIAYDRLGKRERRSRHLAVATHLRETSSDAEEMAEPIATHYLEAFLADRLAAGSDEVRSAAIEWLARAAERAAGVGAPERAEVAFLHAAEISSGEAEALAHRESAAHMALRSGRVSESLQLFEELAEAHRQAGRSTDAARLAGEMGIALGRLGRAGEAITLLEQALAVLDGPEPEEAAARICSQLARELSIAGRAEEALPQVERALILAESLDLPQVMCDAMETKALLLRTKDNFEEALELFDGTIEIANRRGLTSEELLSGHANSADTRMANDLADAISHLESALAIARRVGQKYSETFLSGNLMLAQLFAGDWDSVERCGLTLLGEPRQGLEIINGRMLVLYALRGMAAPARQALSALSRWEKTDSREPRTLYGALESTVLLAEGDPEAALEVSQRALTVALEAFGLRHEIARQAWPDACDAALLSGRTFELEVLLRRLGDEPPARVPPYLTAQLERYRALAGLAAEASDVSARFGATVEEFARLGYPYWRARTILDWGRWCSNHGAPGPGAELVEGALEEARRLGASPLLAMAAEPAGPAA
jgi:class 3 adenylate cyclase/tetratricopeptide (TPR) repeat protein